MANKCINCNNCGYAGCFEGLSLVKVLLLLLMLFSTGLVYAKEVYRCEVDGAMTYQAKPCKNKAKQKVACVNYASASDFKKSLDSKECLDNGANSGGYGGYSSGYYGSPSSNYSNSSPYSSGRTKKQHVSGYTRKDGTYVRPHTRSRK